MHACVFLREHPEVPSPALLHKSFIEKYSLETFENGIDKFIFNSSFKVLYICFI